MMFLIPSQCMHMLLYLPPPTPILVLAHGHKFPVTLVTGIGGHKAKMRPRTDVVSELIAYV